MMSTKQMGRHEPSVRCPVAQGGHRHCQQCGQAGHTSHPWSGLTQRVRWPGHLSHTWGGLMYPIRKSGSLETSRKVSKMNLNCMSLHHLDLCPGVKIFGTLSPSIGLVLLGHASQATPGGHPLRRMWWMVAKSTS